MRTQASMFKAADDLSGGRHLLERSQIGTAKIERGEATGSELSSLLPGLAWYVLNSLL